MLIDDPSSKVCTGFHEVWATTGRAELIKRNEVIFANFVSEALKHWSWMAMENRHSQTRQEAIVAKDSRFFCMTVDLQMIRTADFFIDERQIPKSADRTTIKSCHLGNRNESDAN